jgi:hypothetical protein
MFGKEGKIDESLFLERMPRSGCPVNGEALTDDTETPEQHQRNLIPEDLV